MKYYYPNLASGNLNWNDTLRNYISIVKDCNSDHAFNSLLYNLLENIGNYRADRKFTKSKKYYTQTFETGWISKSQLLDTSLKILLEDLLLFFKPQKNNLVVKESVIYDAEVTHNNEKNNLTTLIIAWNIIKV